MKVNEKMIGGENMDIVCKTNRSTQKLNGFDFDSICEKNKCEDPLKTNNPYTNYLLNKDFDKAEAYRQSKIPKKLYKFVWLEDELRPDGAKNKEGRELNEKKLLSLKNNQIWISSIDKMNDPYEYQCMYVDENRLRDAKYPDELISSFKTMLYDYMKQIGVSCLSAVPAEENLPMWSYYANTHKGFCIEYDVTPTELLYSVSYEPKRIGVAWLLAEVTKRAEELVKNKEATDAEDCFLAIILKQQVLMKHNSWSHEKEYRVIGDLEGKTGLNLDINKVGLKVSRIIGGLECSDKHMKILNEISNQLGLGNAFQIKTSSDSYVCEIRQK